MFEIWPTEVTKLNLEVCDWFSLGDSSKESDQRSNQSNQVGTDSFGLLLNQTAKALNPWPTFKKHLDEDQLRYSYQTSERKLWGLSQSSNTQASTSKNFWMRDDSRDNNKQLLRLLALYVLLHVSKIIFSRNGAETLCTFCLGAAAILIVVFFFFMFWYSDLITPPTWQLLSRAKLVRYRRGGSFRWWWCHFLKFLFSIKPFISNFLSTFPFKSIWSRSSTWESEISPRPISSS